MKETPFVSDNNSQSIEDCLFLVTLQYQYSASEEYEVFMEKYGDQDPNTLDDSTKRYLGALKRGCRNETALNASYMDQRWGSLVTYGDTVQLFHCKSRKFITVVESALAEDERENLPLTMSGEGNMLSWITMVPRFRIDREGDPVKSGTEVYLGSTQRANEFLHASEVSHESAQRKREVNCSMERTSWRIRTYEPAAEAKRTECLHTMDLVYLFDPESRSNITVSTLSLESDEGDNKSTDSGGTAATEEDVEADFKAVTNMIARVYDQGDVVINPIDETRDSNSLWLVEREEPLDGGCINWRSENVRLRHLNRGCYLAVDYHDHLNEETGEAEEIIFVTTLDSKTSEKTLFKINELYNPGNLLFNGKALQLHSDGLWLSRGDFLDESASYSCITTTEQSSSVPLLMQRFVPDVKAAHDPDAAFEEPLDVNVVLSIRKYLWDYHDQCEIPDGDTYPSIFPGTSKAEVQFYYDFMAKAALFVQGHPASVDMMHFIEDLPPSKVGKERQRLMQEQGVLQVLISVINQLIPVSAKGDEIVDLQATTKGAKRAKIRDPDYVTMGKKVLEKCFILLYHCIKGCPSNQMYVADFMPVLLAHLGGGGQPYAGKCVNEMLSTNMELQETKIGSREIAIFISKLRSSRMNPMYLGLLKSCCSCQGSGVDGNQCKVADMLFQNMNDVIIQIHADFTKLLKVDWNTKSLYIPSVPVPGSPVLGDQLLVKGLPNISLSWTTNSIDCSPLGLFGKLSVPIELLYFQQDRRAPARSEPDGDWLSKKKKSGQQMVKKGQGPNKQKQNIGEYFIEEMYLAAEMCMDRNYIAMNKLSPLFTYESLVTIMRLSLNDAVKGAAINLLINLHVDRDPQAQTTIPRLSRAWSEMHKNPTPALPSVGLGRTNVFCIVQELISEYTNDMYRARWTDLSLNMLKLLRMLVSCNFYGTPEKLHDVIDKLVAALDRRGMKISGRAAPEPKSTKLGEGSPHDSPKGDAKPFPKLNDSSKDETKEAEDEDMEEEEDFDEEEKVVEDRWESRWLSVMNSIPFLIFILSLVCVATTIMVKEIVVDSSLTSAQSPPTGIFFSTWWYVDTAISLVFFEVILRGTLYSRLNDFSTFIGDKLNWLDLGLVLMDIIFLLLPFGNVAKPLRLLRVARLGRIFKAARLIDAVMGTDEDGFASYDAPSRYTKTPRVELETMVEVVNVLSYVQKIVDDRNLSLLLRGFYEWESGAAKNSPVAVFENAIEDSRSLNLGGSTQDFDKIFIDVLMFNDPDLVQCALDILVGHHSASSILLQNLQDTQLIISVQHERKFRLINSMLRQLESNAETQELWFAMETSEDRLTAKQTHDIVDELVQMIRYKHKVLHFNEEFGVDKEIQDLFRNLGCFEVCFKVFGLLDSIEEDDDGNIDDAGEDCKALVKECYNLFYWFIKDNKKNQQLAFDHFDEFLDLLDEEVDAHLVIEAMFVNNEVLMRKVPQGKIDEMIKKICVTGHHAEYLVLPRVITFVGDKNLTDNQFAVVQGITAPGRLPKVASFLCGPQDEEYALKRELMAPFQGMRNVQLHELPGELVYHLNLLEVLSGCTVGRLNVTALEAKVQSIYNFVGIIDSIVDEETLLIVRIKMALYFFNAVVEVEIMTAGLEYTQSMWKYVATCPAVFRAATAELKRISLYGWEDEEADRHVVEYMIVSAMIVSGFFHRYYSPQDWKLTEATKTVADSSARVTFEAEQVRAMIEDLHGAIEELYAVDSPLLSRGQKVYIYDALDGANKALYPNSPPMPVNNEASAAVAATAAEKEEEQEEEEVLTPEQEIGVHFKEFVAEIQDDEDLQIRISQESLHFINEVEALPFLRDSAESEVRYEPFIEKLVLHTNSRIQPVNDEKTLDPRCTQSTIWLVQAFRKMIENCWGMTIYERDDDGGAEQDEMSEAVVRAFNDTGVTGLCLELIAPGIDETLQNECIKLCVAMLFKEGGAKEVQATMHEYLEAHPSDSFFRQLRKMTQDLVAWHKWNDVVIVDEGDEPDLPQEILVIRFMQLMCEGHFGPNQDILREQPTNETSINLLDDYISYLNLLSRIPCQTSTDAGIRVSATILEVIQGPCVKTQRHFALSTELIEILNRLMRAQMVHDCLEDAEVELKKTCVDIMQALLEGQVFRSEVYERVLSVIHFDIFQTTAAPPEEGDDELSEDALTLQTECVVLLQMLADYKPELRAELGLGEAIDVVGKDVGCVEVMWMGVLQRRFFNIPDICRDLSKGSKDELIFNVDRSSNENKLIDFVNRAQNLYFEVKHQEFLKATKVPLGFVDMPLDILFTPYTQNLVTWITFILAYVINGLVIGWMKNGPQGETNMPDSVTEGITILNYCNIGFACVTIFMTAVVKWPVIMQTLMEEDYTPAQALVGAMTDTMTMYYVGYLTLSVMSLYNYHFLPFLLFDIIVKFPIAQDVINAVVLPRKMIGMTCLLGFFCMYIFAFFIFYYFRDDLNCYDCSNTLCSDDQIGTDDLGLDDCNENNPDNNIGEGELQCGSLWHCLLIVLANGLYEDGGIGDMFKPDLTNPGRQWIDFGFFLVIIVIMLNIIFGIIIDTFSERRAANAQRHQDTTGVCFMCGIDKQIFDRAADGPNGFWVHTTVDHNIWNYLYFIFYIWEQDKDDDDGLEYYVRAMVDNVDLEWFPMNKALRLNQSHTDEELLRMEMTSKVSARYKQLDTTVTNMQTSMRTMIAKLNIALSDDSAAAPAVSRGMHSGGPNTARSDDGSMDSTEMDNSNFKLGCARKLNVRVVYLSNLPGAFTKDKMMELSCRVDSVDGQMFAIASQSVLDGKLIMDSDVPFVAADGVMVDDGRVFRVQLMSGTGRMATFLATVAVSIPEAIRSEGGCLEKTFHVEGSAVASVMMLHIEAPVSRMRVGSNILSSWAASRDTDETDDELN